MKLVAFFNDDSNFYIDDIYDLMLSVKNSPLISDVFLDFDFLKIDSIIFKEDEHDS